jgi:hypothetical protein
LVRGEPKPWNERAASCAGRGTKVGTETGQSLVQLASAWRARPGSDPRFSVQRDRVIRIPVAGRDSWEQATREPA